MAAAPLRRDDPLGVLRRVADWLDASPAEVAGLVLLALGAIVSAALLWSRAPVAPGPDSASLPSAVPTGHAVVTVHVTGAVARSGLVQLPEGSRVADAIALAGGPTIDADPAALNLARPVNDGEQIVVPDRSAAAVNGTSAGPSGSSAMRPDGRLDLNLATAEELEQLPGIGPVIAERIVAWREEHGPFTEPGQLREVPGIGERTFQQLADLVAV